jgi:hypothetical protein
MIVGSYMSSNTCLKETDRVPEKDKMTQTTAEKCKKLKIFVD